MTSSNPQPGDRIFVEYDPVRNRVGQRYEPWQGQSDDVRAWIRGEHDAQPVEISQQVRYWRVNDEAHELTVTGPSWEAVAETDGETNGANGMASGRIQRVTNSVRIA